MLSSLPGGGSMCMPRAGPPTRQTLRQRAGSRSGRRCETLTQHAIDRSQRVVTLCTECSEVVPVTAVFSQYPSPDLTPLVSFAVRLSLGPVEVQPMEWGGHFTCPPRIPSEAHETLFH